jgi:O-antigen/teichoic acid export membrane protein
MSLPGILPLAQPRTQPLPERPDRGDASPVAERSLRLNVSWTFAGNVFYAACQWGMLVVLAKLGSPEMVGRFALALAVTAPVFMFTNLQLRAVQATDRSHQFAFADYLRLRILSTGLAFSVIAGLAAWSHYQFWIAAVILMVGFAKGSESISDAIYGLVQWHERMDLIARSMMLKGLVSLAAFAVTVALTRSLVMGAAALAMAWSLVLITYDFSLARKFVSTRPVPAGHHPSLPRFTRDTLLRLTRLSIPLGITATLGSLILNVPRYFIEHYAGARALGFFAAVAYLMVAGNLVTNAIAQSATPRLASLYASGEVRAFRTLLLKLCAAAAVPGIAGLLVAVLAGKLVLRLLYRADYESYSGVFTLLMIATAIYCVTAILTNAMTAARIFKPQPALLAAVMLLSAAACYFWIPAHGLAGAAYAIILAAAAQLVGSLVVLRSVLRAPQISNNAIPIIVESAAVPVPRA